MPLTASYVRAGVREEEGWLDFVIRPLALAFTQDMTLSPQYELADLYRVGSGPAILKTRLRYCDGELKSIGDINERIMHPGREAPGREL